MAALGDTHSEITVKDIKDKQNKNLDKLMQRRKFALTAKQGETKRYLLVKFVLINIYIYISVILS